MEDYVATHSDELYYYETLQYFEPIIYKFIAVSQEVGDRLGEYIPSRKKDILIHPYPVHIPQNYVRNYTVVNRSSGEDCVCRSVAVKTKANL
jgi:hypothetical protein